ncbi:MAG: pitrilysin family protein [Bacteroidales bacterium]|jgi:predicted Zn-dependent peptidase|nr:insulinase family protein [Bacteroidales bacterium]MDD4213338.1 pitrilysin family protein [Bacteroidales bacterium]
MMIDRSIQPELKKIEALDIAEPEALKLDNGIPVFIFRSGNIDIIKVDIVFDAGVYYQPEPLVAGYTNKMLREGSAGYTSFEISEKLDYYGAWLSLSANMDTAKISLSAPCKHIKHVLPLLAEMVNYPAFPEKELMIHSKKDKQTFIEDMGKVNEVAAMYFRRQLFGAQHPYGTIRIAEDYDNLTSEKLLAFHASRYLPSYCRMVISGNINKNLPGLLNQYFGYKSSIKRSRATINSFEPENEKKKKIIRMEGSVQSALRVGKIMVNNTHKDYLKIFISNVLLGGYFGSRLMKNIREDKGYTYGIYSVLTPFRHSGAFFITSEVGADVCKKALQEIYKELKKIRTEPVPNSELDIVKKYLTGRLSRSFDGPFETANCFLSLLGSGLNFKKYYQNYIKTLNSITPDEIMHTCNQYLHENSMLELIAGK